MNAPEQYVVELIVDFSLLEKILSEGRITQEEYAQLLGMEGGERPKTDDTWG